MFVETRNDYRVTVSYPNLRGRMVIYVKAHNATEARMIINRDARDAIIESVSVVLDNEDDLGYN